MATDTLRPELLSAANAEEERGVDLLAVTVALVSEWRLGTAVFLISLVLMTAVIFLIKTQYVAKAVILPQGGHASSFSLSALMTSGGSGGILYTGLLDSHSVQDGVIDRTNLMHLRNISSREEARRVLHKKSTFEVGKDGLLTISVKDKDAKLATDITNAYLDSLKALNSRMNLDQGGETRDFFKDQIQDERDQLADAETQLEAAQQRTGMVEPEAQAAFGLSAIASVRAQITELQVQRAALLRGATEQNPQVERLQSEIAQLQVEERTMEQSNSSAPAGAAPSARQLPKASMDVLRARREVVFHTALVTALAQEFETTRAVEEAARPEFQVIDRAIPPEHKSWPPRSIFMAAAVVLSGIVGLIAIVIRLVWRRIETDPEHREQLAQLRQVFTSH